MKKEIINKIISKMEQDLSPVQLKKLENVLSEFQDKQYPITHTTKKNNFIKQFISTKQIEGCSKRTKEYYLSTLTFFEKNIGCNICEASTMEIREYFELN